VSKPLTFSDLPVELQLEIFKLIFVRQEARAIHISQYKTLKVVSSANLSAQFFRVCKTWNEYGSPLLLENVLTIGLASNIQNMIKASVDQKFPRLLQIKHLEMPLSFLTNNSQRLGQLTRFK
jgi:hypothetical protein